MRVAELWTYPVQSLQGEMRKDLAFDKTGAKNERHFAIADLEANSIAHASRPTWKNLIRWAARWLREPDASDADALVEIRFEDGQTKNSDDTELDREISERLGRRLKFVRNDWSQFKPSYRSSPCHFITSASLKAFGAAYPQGNFAPARFRPNVVIDCGEAVGFIEQDWIGRALDLGAVRMRVSEDCDRCALTTRPQGDLPMDAGILHTITQLNRTRAGAYAEIEAPGIVSVGEAVAVGARP